MRGISSVYNQEQAKVGIDLPEDIYLSIMDHLCSIPLLDMNCINISYHKLEPLPISKVALPDNGARPVNFTRYLLEDLKEWMDPIRLFWKPARGVKRIKAYNNVIDSEYVKLMQTLHQKWMVCWSYTKTLEINGVFSVERDVVL